MNQIPNEVQTPQGRLLCIGVFSLILLAFLWTEVWLPHFIPPLQGFLDLVVSFQPGRRPGLNYKTPSGFTNYFTKSILP